MIVEADQLWAAAGWLCAAAATIGAAGLVAIAIRFLWVLTTGWK